MSEASESRSGSLRRNAIANVVGRGASALLWVLVTPFALSHLGQERFAVWSLFFVFGGYVAALDLGMANIVARYMALISARGDRQNLAVVLRRSLTLSAARRRSSAMYSASTKAWAGRGSTRSKPRGPRCR